MKLTITIVMAMVAFVVVSYASISSVETNVKAPAAVQSFEQSGDINSPTALSDEISDRSYARTEGCTVSCTGGCTASCTGRCTTSCTGRCTNSCSTRCSQ